MIDLLCYVVLSFRFDKHRCDDWAGWFNRYVCAFSDTVQRVTQPSGHVTCALTLCSVLLGLWSASSLLVRTQQLSHTYSLSNTLSIKNNQSILLLIHIKQKRARFWEFLRNIPTILSLDSTHIVKNVVNLIFLRWQYIHSNPAFKNPFSFFGKYQVEGG